MSKILTICIPTYNRSDLLINQLEIIKAEIRGLENFVNVIVSDNCSDIIHKDKIIKYYNQNNFFYLNINPSNYGLIGNIEIALSLTDPRFVWFVSDDDILLEGAVKAVVDCILRENDVKLIFLNHKGFFEDNNECFHEINLYGYSKKIEKSMDCLLDLYYKSGLIFMFITACVYDSQTLKKYLENKIDRLVIDPLLYSFNAVSCGSIYIENNIYVLERFYGFSWANEKKDVDYWQIAYGLSTLCDTSNYKKSTVKKMIIHYYKNNLFFVLMLLKSPWNYKFSLLKFLDASSLTILYFETMYAFRKFFTR